MMTCGDFKQLIDKQLATGKGDDELVAHIDWNGLEAPVVTFQLDRRGRDVQDFIYIS